jgi:hypothetical protein
LIVDECHNLMPSPFGQDSDLCEMLRLIAPRFEHRLFLSATPHNGHTRSFTGLLEILDPVRFSQTSELKAAERARVQQIVLRRLKSEINRRSDSPRFCTRQAPEAIPVAPGAEELALTTAFDAFRRAIRRLFRQAAGGRERTGSFAVEILGKRLLSCPTAFAESWRRCKEGLAEDREAAENEVDQIRRGFERDLADDREAQSRDSTAAGVVGAWLKAVAAELSTEIAAIDKAVSGLGFAFDKEEIVDQDPIADARFDALVALIERLVRRAGRWRDDERLVVFTEYKTTLDYLTRRLRAQFEEERILTLFGGMGEVERGLVKQAFNDPVAEVRVLLATDAAAEGLNLQRTARYLLHFDCPWNPSRLEQRNGRLDRHGQARDVVIHHFISESDQDLAFLAHVIRKAIEVREDLGSANEIFDEAVRRRLVGGEERELVQEQLDRGVLAAKTVSGLEDADSTAETRGDGAAAEQRLKEFAQELDLSPVALRDTLEAAMAIRAGRPQLTPESSDSTYRLVNPGLPGWAEVVDEALRRLTARATRGPVARLTFNPDPLIVDVGGRKVFSPRPDVALMHLSHPLYQRVLSVLTRRRFPGGGEDVSRWAVRAGQVPSGVEALILLSLEELAVNELRETFHHWVRTIVFPVSGDRLGPPLEHRPAAQLGSSDDASDPALLERGRDVLEEVSVDLRDFVSAHAEGLSQALRSALAAAGARARKDEDESYRSRQGEISTLIADNTLSKLEREVHTHRSLLSEGLFAGSQGQLEQIAESLAAREAELERRRKHYQEIREQLERERTRVLNQLLPRRFAMVGEAHVFPVAVEVRLPGGLHE